MEAKDLVVAMHSVGREHERCVKDSKSGYNQETGLISMMSQWPAKYGRGDSSSRMAGLLILRIMPLILAVIIGRDCNFSECAGNIQKNKPSKDEDQKNDLFNCGHVCKYCGVNMDTTDLESLKFLHMTCWQEYRKNGESHPFHKNFYWELMASSVSNDMTGQIFY